MNYGNSSGCHLRSIWKLPKSVAHLTILQTLLHFKDFSTNGIKQRNESQGLNKALKVIDLVSAKPILRNNQESHLQLIRDFLQSHSKNFIEERSFNDFTFPDTKNKNASDKKLSSFFFKKDHPILQVIGLLKEGFRIDVAVLSYALSGCGCAQNLRCGTQLQCVVVRNGFFMNVYIGSSLISMYSKCGDLCSAYKVFEEMPVRNVVSWTALISGFAQECMVDVCLELYSQMRNSTLKPNDFTLTSLLSACVGSGSLGHGRSAHCQAILWGFDSYIHVANALIAMYCKCGHHGDAFCVFEAIHRKDIVSWNSMIAGYALHGLAHQAIDLFEEMRKQMIKPDGITFLGVLSSCRHAGFINQGRNYFNSMVEDGVEPDLGHYSCIVDLLGRAGLLEEARDFIRVMPIRPNAIIWGSLLSSCRIHDNVWIGIEAAENRLMLEPSCAATHVQLTKLYVRVGLWDQVARVQKVMKDTEMRTNPGYSWIEIGNEVYRFKADDTSNSRMNEILLMLEGLMDQMTVMDYVPELHEEVDIDAYTIFS